VFEAISGDSESLERGRGVEGGEMDGSRWENLMRKGRERRGVCVCEIWGGFYGTPLL